MTEKKTVLITGCTDGGLGAAMARAYEARGFRVFATLRSLSKAGTLGEMEGVELLELDVTSDESIHQCTKAVEKLTGGSLDILVNNAAANNYVIPLLDSSIEQAKKVYEANVWAPLAMVKAFAPMIICTKGTICNISSVSCELVFGWSVLTLTAGIYNSSKSALTMLSETLRIELAPLGVKVVTAILGGMSTNAFSNVPDLELPETSYYGKIASIIDYHHKGLAFTSKQNVDVAAKNIVNDVLNGRVFIRRGDASTISWLCTTFIPSVTLTNMINKDKGFDKLERS
ncbi:unnamed protein product [Clonostachys rhizophaga]|uniref:Uncharacterized protein n=1 Tax=Clonostachys rhizophaga TaxID=160324 RepID=A0A9N9YWK5_9HYPO|nr:unnamed protein product [Clonostachys rhizophaga]